MLSSSHRKTCRFDFVYGVYGGTTAPYTGSSPYFSTAAESVYGVYGQKHTHIYTRVYMQKDIRYAHSRA